jgi:endonuclease/exonuclease/phosphatase family metal-dependent hydrolase
MFKLVTWNIQSGRSPDGNTDLDRIIACLERFCSFDMLCVQEVSSGYTPSGEDQFAMLRERLSGYTGIDAVALDTAAPGGRAGQRRRFGSMVLSRHPVLGALRHSLPWPAEPEMMSMPRTALELTVAAPGGLLRVTTVHLEHFSQRQRLAQVERLRELHREGSQHARCPAPGHGPFAVPARAMPALLAGDFNMLPGSPEHQRLLAPFCDGTQAWRDCWHLTQPGRRHAPTVGLHDPHPEASAPFTFDYVFASADLADRVRRVRVDASEQGSSHQALLVELDWGP